jgi:hypothetical protein
MKCAYRQVKKDRVKSLIDMHMMSISLLAVVLALLVLVIVESHTYAWAALGEKA